MRMIVSFLLILNLTGCMYQVAENVDLRKAEYFCKGVKNVNYVTITAIAPDDKVVCIDGTAAFMNKIKIPLE